MADKYASNPFQGIDVSIPIEFHEHVTRFSQREARANIDQSPFPRMVDMWFLAVCVAARLGLPLADIAKYETRKIIEGSIFSSDPWRIHILMLIAIQREGNVEVVSDPRRMMTIANGLAVAGLPKVLDMLNDGGGDAIWNLSEAIETLVKQNKAA